MNKFFIRTLSLFLILSLLLSLGAYGLGLLLQRRWKLPIFNPLLVAIVVVAVVLLLLDLDYGSYSQGANLLNYLLTPATVCLAVPLYEQFSLLRRHGKAVLLGIAAGVLASLVTILVLAWLFSLDHSAYVTLLPKSITTAIGIGVTEILGGHVSLSVGTLEHRGLLRRRREDRDRRQMHLELTEAGWEIARCGQAVQKQFFSAAFQGITRQELEDWYGILQRMWENMQAMQDNR